jgi:2-dehydropantoate 2-reductase
MRIAVVGVGGVGGFFGGRLARSGVEVIFIARGENLRVLREKGLRIDSSKGHFTLPNISVTDNPGEVGTVEAVLIAVKSWQVPEAAKLLPLLVDSETMVLPLQNGIEAPNQLAEVLGSDNVLGGLCRIISRLEKPGHIIHVGVDPFIALGELDNRGSNRILKLKKILEDAGVKVKIPTDIHLAMWQKLLLISAISGVGAFSRVSIGIFRHFPKTRNMLEEVMRETIKVGKALGIPLPSDSAEKAMAFLDTLPPNGTSSMQRDIMAGLPSELEAQNGTIVRLGRKVGVLTPMNSLIYRSLLPLELKARKKTNSASKPDNTAQINFNHR